MTKTLKDLPSVLLLIDIDSTVSNTEHREHFLDQKPKDWVSFFHACDGDAPIPEMILTLKKHIDNQDTSEFKYFFLTGRSGYPEVKEKTKEWLDGIGFDGDRVIYRHPKRFERSYVYKVNALQKYLSNHNHNPNPDLNVIIIDDDEKVIEKFKELGHITVQVNTANYKETANEIDTLLSSLLTTSKKPNA